MPFESMSMMQKFGLVILGANDPSVIPRFMAQEQQQQEFEMRKQEYMRKVQERQALSDFSQNIPSDPYAALSQYGALTGDPTKAIEYKIEQPMRDLQMQSSRASLANTYAALAEKRAKDEEEKRLEAIFANSVTPAVPASSPLSGIGPTRPAIPEQSLSQQEVLRRAAAEDPVKFGPLYAAALGGSATEAPSNVREFQFYENLPADKKPLYLAVKRAQQTLDLGGSFVALNPTQPGTVTPLAEKTLAPADLPETKRAQAEATEIGKFSAELSKRAANAENSLDVIAEAEILLPKATGSGFGALRDIGSGLIGYSNEKTQTNAKLQAMAGWLKLNTPRMEGPQSDKDSQTYGEMVADIGNRWKPYEDRMVAVTGVKTILKRYAHLNKKQSGDIKLLGWENK